MARAILVIVVLLIPTVLHASTGGTLVVTVKDVGGSGKPGNVLPGATVLLSTNSDLGPGAYGLRTAVAGIDGRAVFFNVHPGDYWLRVELAGFESWQWLVDVPSGVTRRVSVAIEVGITECDLGKLWDLRGTLDPGIGPNRTLVRLGKTAP